MLQCPLVAALKLLNCISGVTNQDLDAMGSSVGEPGKAMGKRYELGLAVTTLSYFTDFRFIHQAWPTPCASQVKQGVLVGSKKTGGQLSLLGQCAKLNSFSLE